MEIAGGLMIMAILLGLLCAAVWLSLPIFLFSLRNRLAESRLALEELSRRITALEKCLEQLHVSASACPDQAVLKSEREE